MPIQRTKTRVFNFDEDGDLEVVFRDLNHSEKQTMYGKLEEAAKIAEENPVEANQLVWEGYSQLIKSVDGDNPEHLPESIVLAAAEKVLNFTSASAT